MAEIAVPDLALVVLVGTAGAGKSTFAARHFRPTEVVSSDTCRALVSDDPGDQSATASAFAVLHLLVDRRLAGRRFTVVDATNVAAASRLPLLATAREHHVATAAVVWDLPPRIAAARDAARPGRTVGPHVLRHQRGELRRSLPLLYEEGFEQVTVMRSPAEVDAAVVRRVPRGSDRRADRGPFDLVGDVHGCLAELRALLAALGYRLRPDGAGAVHAGGRRAVLLGDLAGGGPDSAGVLRLVMGMAAAGDALVVAGDHDDLLLHALRGGPGPDTRAAEAAGAGGPADTHQIDAIGAGGPADTHQIDAIAAGGPADTHQIDAIAAGGPADTHQIDAIAAGGPGFAGQVEAFLTGLPGHLVLDGGRLVAAHAGLPAELHDRTAASVRAAALHGMPGWAEAYRGSAAVVHGHTPVARPRWRHRTICVDTGCVHGGRLTALRWPERELVSVPSNRGAQA